MRKWRLRILEWNGLDVETLAEVESCLSNGLARELHPEIERIASGVAAEAVEEMALAVDGEAARGLAGMGTGGCADRTLAAHLVTANRTWRVIDQREHVGD